MRKDPAPVPLRQAAEAHARAVYADRLKELQGMEAALARLDMVAAALHMQGLELHPADLRWSRLDRAITVAQCHFSDRGNRQLTALLEMGFKEVERMAYTTFACVTLQKGRIRLRLHIDTRTPAAVTAATGTPTTKDAA